MITAKSFSEQFEAARRPSGFQGKGLARSGGFRHISPAKNPLSGKPMKLLLLAGWALSSALGLMAQDKSADHDEPVPTLHAYADLVQMPTLVLGQNRKKTPAIRSMAILLS